MDSILIVEEDPESDTALLLIEELSATLTQITGDGGKSSFVASDVRVERACFVLARNSQGEALGCGALRPMDKELAEIKRMYARPGTRGVGLAILAHLEAEAQVLGYHGVRLETRRVNQRAIEFYLRHGYQRIDNFGKYIGRPEAVCFEKAL